MKYEWDENKNRANQIKHDVNFDKAVGFCWDSAIAVIDTRFEYGEERWMAYGIIKRRLYCMVYTHRGDTIRIINLRKANSREVKRYEK